MTTIANRTLTVREHAQVLVDIHNRAQRYYARDKNDADLAYVAEVNMRLARTQLDSLGVAYVTLEDGEITLV